MPLVDNVDWEGLWKEEKTPWDLSGPHEATSYIAKKLQTTTGFVFKEKKVVIPGAGSAHDAAVFLDLGAAVTAIDLSKTACQVSSKLYGHIDGFSVIHSDVTKMSSDFSCDVIFDRAMLCALNGDKRLEYVKACTKMLKPGGFFITVAFTEFTHTIDGPPFLTDEYELAKMFGDSFNLVRAEKSSFNSGVELITKELIYIYTKK